MKTVGGMLSILPLVSFSVLIPSTGSLPCGGGHTCPDKKELTSETCRIISVRKWFRFNVGNGVAAQWHSATQCAQSHVCTYTHTQSLGVTNQYYKAERYRG